MIPVVDSNGVIVKGVYRDRHGALIINDESQLAAAKQRKLHSETLDKNIQSLEQRQIKTDSSIAALSEEIHQVKNMLQQILGAINNNN
jgi:prefoldin subunit 5